VPAMCFLDLAGYTRLTEERGDQAAAELAGTLAELVCHTAREHSGLPVKWLGHAVMVYFREPAAAVRAALQMVERLPAAGLPPAHVGVAAGPVVAQGGDYFGRTVNLAARIAAHAGPGQVLVSASVAEAGLPAGVALEESGEVRLKGFARPVRLALRSEPSTWPRQICLRLVAGTASYVPSATVAGSACFSALTSGAATGVGSAAPPAASAWSRCLRVRSSRPLISP
jgi:class 3 adenylate cyclase